MRRMPIRHRNEFLWPLGDVPEEYYGVLGGISTGYPPVTARLHTCYSPVRRSPAVEGKPSTPLPLDLHVLSLSLAFILSQDQTLRCCILFSLFLKLMRIAPATQTEGFQLIVPPCPGWGRAKPLWLISWPGFCLKVLCLGYWQSRFSQTRRSAVLSCTTSSLL